MGPRIFAALLAVLFGTAAALAQNAAPKPKPAAAAAAKDKAKPKRTENKRTENKATENKTAEKKKPAKPKPKADSKSEAAENDEPASPKNKKKKSADAPDKSSTTGSASAATPQAKSSLREAFATMPLPERIALQSDLIWTGDFNGLIDGQFSDRLADAVTSYQKRQKAKPTGVLSAQERAALSASIRPRQEEVGWRLAEDPVTGARVGLPGKIATKITTGASGTRWSSEQGQLQIETFRIDTGATLEAVFEQQKKLPRQRITYNVLRPDFFVVSGMRGLKKMYVRGFAKDGEVRGITILYDQAMEGTMDPIVVAMSNAFMPFASYAVAGADMPRRKVEYGTGLVVSVSGHVVTARHVLDGCQVITIPGLGHAERLADDKDSALTLLRVYGANGPAPIRWSGAAPGGDNVTLLGIADPQTQGGGSAVTATPAKLRAEAIEPAPAPGFSGAAALDSQGQLLGVAVQRPAMVAGAGGAAQAALVPLAQLRNFLEAHYVAPAAGRSGLEDSKAAVVRVICVRK